MVAHDIGPDGDAELTILDHPIERSDFKDFKKFQVLLALRERTRLDEKFFAACYRCGASRVDIFPNIGIVMVFAFRQLHMKDTYQKA